MGRYVYVFEDAYGEIKLTSNRKLYEKTHKEVKFTEAVVEDMQLVIVDKD